MIREVVVPIHDNVKDRNVIGEEVITVYDYESFPYDRFRNCSIIEQGKRKCFNVIATFDIETTTIMNESILGTPFGFMYVWQFCIEGFICMGRTWEEYGDFLLSLQNVMGFDEFCPLVIWVHNLQFEFQFMRNFFEVNKIFATDKRNVIRAEMEGCEYRCSYRLTNMGLEKATQKTKNVKHFKLSGKDFDYSVKRYPDTELTNAEYGYCIYDVLGLYEVIKEYLEDETLLSIPMTSTGYVRRDYREAVQKKKRNDIIFKEKALTEYTYALCQEASRGAISGSNHVWTDEILEEVESEDIKSSYPYQMATKYFPANKFLKAKCKFGNDKFYDYIKNNCCLITWSCENLSLKRYSGIPYISKAKCRAIKGGDVGNGKVYRAARIGMTCTEIDFEIICNHYNFINPVLYEIWVCDRSMLSVEFRKHLLHMFQMKTDLEDGDKFLYDKYKNKINASFGMMLTDILHPEIVYHPNSAEPWTEEEIPYIDKALREYYNRASSFLSYQDGVWVLAHARNDLVKGMDIVENDIVQVDTDSVKSKGKHRKQFEELNSSIIEQAENYSIKPYAIKNGHKHYLGIWEYEGTYYRFKTLGAKKYAVETQDGEIKITVAGLAKSAGKYIRTKGGLDFFENGSVVPSEHSGRTASYYVDLDYPRTIDVYGHKVTLGSNIAIKNVSYTFSMTGEWLELVMDGVVNADEDFEFHGAYGCK